MGTVPRFYFLEVMLTVREYFGGCSLFLEKKYLEGLGQAGWKTQGCGRYEGDGKRLSSYRGVKSRTGTPLPVSLKPPPVPAGAFPSKAGRELR